MISTILDMNVGVASCLSAKKLYSQWEHIIYNSLSAVRNQEGLLTGGCF